MKKKQMSFSVYLLSEGLITKEQLDRALAIQNKDRLLGTLAKEMGLLSEEDLLRIREYQNTNNVKFGEATISLGFISSSQLRYLLDVRLRRKIRIGEILVKEGFIDKEKLYSVLMHYEKNRLRLKKILVCDSAGLVNALLKNILEKYDYHVEVTENPSEAINIAVRDQPNLLIISHVFEEMSGLEVCSKLLARSDMSELNIIFLAQDINKELMDNAFEVGVQHFLKKPVEEYELLNIIYNIEQKEQEKKREKILVVEDSDLIRQVIVRELKQHGYTVLQAPNGRAALTLAKSEKPDLITMDIIMPGIDGYETCKRLRNDPVTQDTPVIMITVCDSAEERMKGFEAGAVEYFAKPFVPNQLANYIKVLFETKKARRKQRALVIEDTLTTLHIIKHILEKQGIEVVTAGNGKEGMEKISMYPPDIILSDIYMPEMDGFKICHKIKKSPETKHIPFIFLTGSGKKDDTLKGLALGANDYITKPFDEDELSARVNNLLINKSQYEELKLLNSRLEIQNVSLEKLHKEKENFYSILTHDLRSPLTSILGFSDYLLKEDGGFRLDDDIKTPLKIIKSVAERQMGIIEDALEIFQSEIQKQVKVRKEDLGEVVNDVVLSQFKEIQEKGVEVIINGKPYSSKKYTPLTCSCNRSKISRVIDNLLRNASKYAKKKIEITYESKKNLIEVCVLDDGKGIPEQYRKKIFEDFFRIPGSEKGTGLGLSSAKRIIEAHKGKIWTDPSPGKCAFRFTFPG